ncbi:helicase-related protein [Agrobacterium radiobacter]|uniref:helicase-related protein n=1 Tax=Agrobacterium radiobacter TaxID=362 RepID=UPI003F86D089
MSQDPDESSARLSITDRLAEDLIGPRKDDEILTDRPTDYYLSGILWPQRTKMSGEEDDTLGTASAVRSSDNEESGEAEAVPATSVQKPSVAGLSFSVLSVDEPRVLVRIQFARYRLIPPEKEGEKKRWARNQIDLTVEIGLAAKSDPWIDLGRIAPEADGARLHIRCIQGAERLLVTISLVNFAPQGEGRDELEMASLFQTSLYVTPLPSTSLLPKPPHRGKGSSAPEDSDERSNLLLFRNVFEFAAGHVCSAQWGPVTSAEKGLPSTEWVATSWLPSATVPGVNANGHGVFHNLKKEALSARKLAWASEADLRASLTSLCDAYALWLDGQHKLQKELEKDERADDYLVAARENLSQCGHVLERMIRSVDQVCSDSALRRAFQLSNLAMHLQHQWDTEKTAYGELRWRPFQLGFLLLSAVSSARREDDYRRTMDLLWFPTGGGKTEAYLALIAFVAFYRRLSDDPADHQGVASLMRYTLRLLTTQQFARSAAMILACELIRTAKIDVPAGTALKGHEPFSIGLWVGGDATPNRLAEAYTSLNGSREVASPKQLALCPACRNRVSWTQASITSPVIAACDSEGCVAAGPLNVWTVDDDVYRVRPTLIVGTVDKFAQIVRRPETNDLFGISHNSPPDLIIQDELHLISGPLGTVAGTYEAAFDLLFSNKGRSPKVIGSTATIRRAAEQVNDLFDRQACQFPPPAIDHNDSGFAVHDPASTGRRYVGVSTAGRSAKFTLQAVSASLLQSASSAFSTEDERDPYWTLIGYFNSLRELGGALVLMQDDVADGIKLYSRARGETERKVKEVQELTSRRTQEDILKMLEMLAIRAGDPGSLDVMLATNMVSVGVDIPRLGLMIVNGQPKTTAEYIQATSRVGRGKISGLVVAILNNAKARDRSHFETFPGWHQALYRDVEATSVTPFASRARDRSLHAALVAAVRHLAPGMLNRPGINDAAATKARELIDLIVERANRIDPEERAVRSELERRLEEWGDRSPTYYWQDHKVNSSLLQSAERVAWKKALGRNPGAAWSTLNSMRNVEAGTPFRMTKKLKAKDSNDGEQ